MRELARERATAKHSQARRAAGPNAAPLPPKPPSNWWTLGMCVAGREAAARGGGGGPGVSVARGV